MPHLFVCLPATADDWAVAELESDGSYRLARDPLHPVRRAAPEAGTSSESHARILAARRADGGERWLLLAGDAAVRVNGGRLAAGLRVLADRDEIGLPGGPRYYFSMERLARSMPFPGAEQAIRCPRCTKPLEAGQPGVACPFCGIWHHETSNLPCWTYAEESACGCRHPTGHETGYRWTPEGL